MTPLIPAENDFAVWAVLIGIAAFGFWCERYPLGRKYSGVMWLITLAIVLSNLRVIPSQAPAYGAVLNYLVPVAIPLLLLQIDLRRLFREAGRTLVAFVIGSATVVAGVFVAVALIDLGAEEAKLAGIFAGTYIGGSLNFAAIASVTEFADDTLLSAAFAADNLITNLHLIVILALPGVTWVSRAFDTSRKTRANGGLAVEDQAFELRTGEDSGLHRIADLDIAGLLASLGLAFALAALGNWIGAMIGRPHYAILATTALALGIATFAKAQVDTWLSGCNEAGTALLFIFLATIGASADIWRLVEAAPILFLFALVVVTLHLAVLLVVGRVLRLGLAEMCIASAVCVGGPAFGPAIASAKGWRDLMIPGVLAGSFGYAIGSFIGVSVWEFLRQAV
ncbi:MAG: DUF819 family protein [Pseudomonadota bacterium]